MTRSGRGVIPCYLLGLVLWTGLGRSEPAWTLSTAAEAPPTEAAEALRAVLAHQALRLADGDGGLLLELWLRQGIEVQATAEQVENGLTWAEFAPTTLLGVLRVHAPLRDYRNQELPPGVYTLRLALQPQQDEHLGTAPHAEFAMLVEADRDRNLELMEPRQLQQLSAAALGGKHPAVLLLWPCLKQAPATVKLTAPAAGHQAIHAPLAVVAGGTKTSLGLRLNVAGRSPKAR